MIDFPASPTTGQIFAGTNGVTYMWTGTIWVATGSSSGGDFCVSSSGGTLPTTLTTTLPSTPVSGNSGNWYNSVNGRFTPPAGRYYLYAQVAVTNASGATGIQMIIRKNASVTIANALDAVPVAGGWGFVSPSVTIDANGADFFDVQIMSVAASSTAGVILFGAYPISGVKGPPGDPGQLGFRLLQRTDVSSAVASVDITNIASDINDLRFTFDLSPVTNAVDLVLQFYDNVGALDSTNGHYIWAISQSTHVAAGGTGPFVINSNASTFTSGISLDYFGAGTRVSNVANDGISGSGTIINIRNTARGKHVDYQSCYLDDAVVARRIITGSGVRVTVGAITGFRLVFTSGNVASGAFSVWGSP